LQPTHDCGELSGMARCKSLRFLPVLLLALSACTRDPKVLAQRYLDNGNKFFAKGKFKEASIMYRSALLKDLRFGEAYYRLGLTDLKLGAYSDAVQKLRRAVELEPNNSDAPSKLADLYLLAASRDRQNSAELVKDASQLADKLLAQNPNSFDGHRLRGQLALLPKDRDVQAAIKEFAAANQTNPLQPDLCLSYVQALILNNQGPEAEKLARDVIAKEKNYAPMYDILYYQYARQNKLDQAEQVLQLKTQNNPKNASYLLQLATHYYLVKRRDDMESVVRQMNDEKAFPDGRLLVGDFFFFRLREFDRARQQYEDAMKVFPKDKAVYQKRLVELYASTGKNPEANQLLATILKDNPKDNDAIAMRATLMLTSGDRNQISTAVNDLQGLVTKTPTNHMLRYNLARSLAAKGETAQAQLQLEEAIKIRPDFTAARELLARLYMLKGDNPKALKAADDLIAIDPNNLQGHLVRSNALLNLQDRDKAQQELELIVKAYPQNAEARFQTGALALMEKDYKKANQIFSDLYKSNPKDSRGLVGVVETLAAQDHLPEAIAQLEQAVRAEPDHRDLKMALGNLYVRAKQYDRGIEIFKAELDKDPKSHDLLFKLAETNRLKGDSNLAMDYFRRASEAAPGDARSLLQLGILMDGTGRSDQAEPIYEQVLKLDPSQAVALNNLAYLKAEHGVDLESALSMAQRARQAAPKSPQIADTLGWIYIRKNLSEEAIRIFKDVTAQEPNNPAFHYHYGMALLQKGDRASAKRELDAAMKNNPSQNDRVKIQELLQKL
jgi:tetratricopeptide (TPR) repeat protein